MGNLAYNSASILGVATATLVAVLGHTPVLPEMFTVAGAFVVIAKLVIERTERRRRVTLPDWRTRQIEARWIKLGFAIGLLVGLLRVLL